MQVFVDSLIYQLRSSGGIARSFTELLPRACDEAADLQVNLLVTGKLQSQPPAHSRIAVTRAFPVDDLMLPTKYWWRTRVGASVRSMLQNKHVSRDKSIWHSTYYTPPPRNMPTVVTVHDLIYERMPEHFDSPAAVAFRRHKKRSIQRANAITTVSVCTKQDLQELYALPDERIRVVPNGVSSAFRPLPASEYERMTHGRPFLLYVGGRARYKNFWGFVDAFRKWSKAGEVALVVVGHRWSQHELRRLENLGASQHVILLTQVEDDTLAKLMNAALALVHPSLYEGFGLPVLEAMACGCPVVANRIPAVVEIASQTPYYFDAASTDSLHAALDCAVSAGRQPERVQSGIEQSQRYTWHGAATKLISLYRDLV